MSSTVQEPNLGGGTGLLLHVHESEIREAKDVPRLRLQVLKRLIANSLLGILIASVLAPLVVSFQQSSVPACCRRNGKHRCMMAMSGISTLPDSGTTLRNATPDCPYRSHPSRLTGAQSVLRIPLKSIWLISTGAVESYHYSLRHSHSITLRPPRGPPAAVQFT